MRLALVWLTLGVESVPIRAEFKVPHLVPLLSMGGR